MYTPIFPPGKANALTWSLSNTTTSHCSKLLCLGT
ncbi:Uncharacterised protein [Vibrio cholerae]|nr:Uncharacterised protein [Vibrio cholerae]